MAVKSLFSVSIFLIVFRETLEAVVIVSVLLGLVQQIVHDDAFTTLIEHTPPVSTHQTNSETTIQTEGESDTIAKRRLVRKLRIQVCQPFCAVANLINSFDNKIFAGAGVGMLIAFALGAAFIAIWFTEASNLWTKAELLWEGHSFSLAAARHETDPLLDFSPTQASLNLLLPS
jgi:high-affinity iron transporter